MTAKAKNNLVISALTLVIPLYYVMVAAAVTFIYDDYQTGQEAYVSYVILGDSIISTVTCFLLSLTSSLFGFRTLRFSKNNRTAALGLVLAIVPLLFAALFTWWML